MGQKTWVVQALYPCLSKQRYGHADIAGTYPFSVRTFVLWQPTIISISIVDIQDMEYFTIKSNQK